MNTSAPTATRLTASNTDTLAVRFREFAQAHCPEEPLYQAISHIVAADARMLSLLLEAAESQQLPNLWLAAVHDRLLESRLEDTLKGTRHPLADYYASCGGQRAPDEALAAALQSFVAQEAEVLRESMRTRGTQTNEIGRCAVLWPLLQQLAERSAGRPLALLDVGCSAGLNLGVDCYNYDYGEHSPGTPAADGVPRIECQVIGGHRPGHATTPAHLASRLGIDPDPIDVGDKRQLRWLQACLWPSNTVRAERLAYAASLARQHRWPVRQEADCTAAVTAWVAGLPDGVQPVVFNSWVLRYFEPAALRRHIKVMTGLVRSRGVLWLSCEGPELHIGPVHTPPAPDAATASGSLWTLCSPAAPGSAHSVCSDGVRFEVLARSHPHGRWVQWLGAR